MNNISTMEISGQGPDGDSTTVWAKIDGRCALEIQRFGTGEYRWKAYPYKGPESDTEHAIGHILDNSMGPKDAEGYYGPASLGVCAAYFEPKTFAYAVRDVILNG